MTRVVCISDTHLAHEKEAIPVPEGDVLLHTGDATFHGSLEEIQVFDAWFSSLPHPHKVFIAGNHDWGFQRKPEESRAALDSSIHYLEDSEVTVAGLRIWGTPWQPEFCNWAFNLPLGEPLREIWAKIPEGVDIVMSHGPPAGLGDALVEGPAVGCPDLLDELLTRIRPRVHVCGHIHEGYGVRERDGITFVNASTLDHRYRVANPAVCLDL